MACLLSFDKKKNEDEKLDLLFRVMVLESDVYKREGVNIVGGVVKVSGMMNRKSAICYPSKKIYESTLEKTL